MYGGGCSEEEMAAIEFLDRCDVSISLAFSTASLYAMFSTPDLINSELIVGLIPLRKTPSRAVFCSLFLSSLMMRSLTFLIWSVSVSVVRTVSGYVIGSTAWRISSDAPDAVAKLLYSRFLTL